MSTNEISDSLIQEVMACNEMPSQWSEQSTIEDAAAADRSSTADQNHGVEDVSAADESQVPIAEVAEH